MVLDAQLSDSEFLRRARVDEFTVISNGVIQGGEVPQSTVEILVAQPLSGALARGPVAVSGTAVDLNARTNTGISAVRVLALTASAGTIDLGQATYGIADSGAATRYSDARFSLAGFELTFDSSLLPNGAVTLRVEALSSQSGQWVGSDIALSVDNSPPPTLQAISPTHAVHNAGDLPVVIRGANLEGVRTARIGDIPLAVTAVTSHTIQAVAPLGLLQSGTTYPVTVQSAQGSATLAGAFRVDPDVEQRQVRVMVIIACDDGDLNSSLLSYCEDIFKQLQQAVNQNPELYVNVLWDGPEDDDSGYYLVQPGLVTRLGYHGMPEAYTAMDELDTGSPEVIGDFIRTAQGNYPSTYKLLAMFGHGGGWASRTRPPTPAGSHPPISGYSGMLVDRNPTDSLDTMELAAIIRQMNQGDGTIDVVYLDACLMGAVEVVAEVGMATRYLLVSEEISWPFPRYNRFLESLTTVTSAPDLATQIIDQTAAGWSSDYPMGLWAVDMAKSGELMSALDSLAAALLAHLPSDRVAILATVQSTLHLNDGYMANPTDWTRDAHDSTIDTLDFARRLQHSPVDPAIQAAAAGLEQAMTTVRLHNAAQDGKPREGDQRWDMHSLGGLSLYFPLDISDHRLRYYTPAALPVFGATTRWDDFISAWHAGTALPPDPEPCDDCLVFPGRVTLHIPAPPQIAVTAIDDVVYIPVNVKELLPSDQLRGFDLTLEADDLAVLAPATNETVRRGALIPADELFIVRQTARGWNVLLNLPPSMRAISGEGRLFALPFRVRGSGTTRLRLSSHSLADHTLQLIPHVAQSTAVTTQAGRAAQLSGSVALQWDPDLSSAVTVQVSGGLTHQAYLDAQGNFAITLRPGRYEVRVRAANHLIAQRTISLSSGATATLGSLVLWAGDLNGRGQVSMVDWRICAAARAPVNEVRYDLNGDGVITLLDCQAIRNNLGVRGPTLHNPALGWSSLRDQVEPHVEQSEAPTLRICAQEGRTISLCLAEQAPPLYAVGARLRLPPGAQVETVTWATPEGYLNLSRTDQDMLYLLTALDESEAAGPLLAAAPLVQITLSADASQTVIEAISPVTSDGWASKLMLPLVRR